ncbi:MAG TPA: ROK family protein [Acidimicrobiia bacterium]|nr:ROK family protein [Acidimicrobiia bacterium]
MDSIGIDIGGTSIKAVRLGVDGVVEQNDEVPFTGTPGEMIGRVADLVASLRQSATGSVGVGIAGLVRWPEGVFVWGPHVRGENLALRQRLAELLGLPVVVDNDANCAALAELRMGAAKGSRNAVVMTLGTGIGAGVIADGVVYRGESFAGEAGHMTMIPDGDPCECGRRGCWETLVSGRRFGEEARRLMRIDPRGILASIVGGAEPNGSFLGLAAASGDVGARDAVIEAGRWLGRGVANLVAILDPELIVVGGTAVAVGELLIDTAREEAVRSVEGSSHRRPIRIEVAQCGPRAGAIGAALLARETLQLR